MNCINDFNCLIDFIKENPNDFDIKLKKQFAISTKICPYNKDWYMFKYDQFESDFCNPIVRAARGSVLEIKSNIRPICLPFYKFNNLGQEGCDEVDWNTAEVSLKIDGSLIKISKIDNEIFLFTNGSWADQEVEPTGLAGEETETDNCKTYADFINYCLTDKPLWFDNIPNNTTMMFELVGPKTRVLVKYPKTKMYFLGARDNLTTKEYKRVDFKNKYEIPFDVPPTFDFDNEKDLLKELEKWEGDKEGVVICDSNFRRIKIKTDAYKKLKFIRGEGNFSEKAILQSVIEGSEDDAMAAFPELYTKIIEIKNKVRNYLEVRKSILAVGNKEYEDKLLKFKDAKIAKKEYFLWTKSYEEEIQHLLLKCLNKDEEFVKKEIFKNLTIEKLRS